MLTAFWRSTIGKKVVMAVTGLILVGFIISHVAANLLVFTGPAAINAYGLKLRELGPLLWVARAVLLVAVVLHIVAAIQLKRIDAAARPVDYRKWEPNASTWASRTMIWGGLLLLVFIVFHLLHFTVGTVHPEFVVGDIYRNVIVGFGVWWVALFYIVAMVALGLHLFHGFWASFRTLGLYRPGTHPLKKRAAVVLAVAVWLGFTIIPVAVLAGLLRLS